MNGLHLAVAFFAATLCIAASSHQSGPRVRQPDMASVLLLAGATAAEELDAEVIERFEELARHPVEINLAPRQRLLSSGLFSAYQVASIIDYRLREGDILSLTELSLVSGFGAEYVNALAPYISLRSAKAPGQSTTAPQRVDMDLRIRGCARQDGDPDGLRDAQWSYGGKFAMDIGGTVQLRAGTRRAYSAKSLSGPAWSVGLHGRKGTWSLVLGDFNARYGQGLAMWSGFTMAGCPTAGACCRHQTGISVSSSYDAVLRGAAAQFDAGAWSAAVSAAAGGVISANITHAGLSSEYSLTAVLSEASSPVSLAFRLHPGRVPGAPDLFGELAFDMCGKAPAAVFGCMWRPSYGSLLSLCGRWYGASYGGLYSSGLRSSTKTSDEAGVAAGVKWGGFNLAADWCMHPSGRGGQFKCIAALAPELKLGTAGPGECVLTPSLRFAGRYRPSDALPWHNDLRADMKAQCGPWMASFRWNALWCRDFAWLWYLEAGYKSRWACYLRGGLFRIDSWDDRIYVYERDAPGNFNVPAYSGRGWNLSLYLDWHGLGLRLSTVRYPWIEKPSRTEVRLQYRFKL